MWQTTRYSSQFDKALIQLMIQKRAGRSLPDWLSDRKRRRLIGKSVGLQRRIELIQDFAMPDASDTVVMSNDGKYIYAAGTYKPRIRCYDVQQLSLKFERCVDSEVIKMKVLSDGYEKLVMIEKERWLEFHVQYGHYFRTRIPKFARDFSYIESTAELYIAGSGPDIFRLNLELGQFNTSLNTSASSLTACDVNPEHYLFLTGTYEGKILAFDPRVSKCVGELNCTSVDQIKFSRNPIPSVSCLKFKNALTFAAGMENGLVMLYDIRGTSPLLVKDHQYGKPIKAIAFNHQPEIVLSADCKIVKLWHERDGKPFTSVEPNVKINDLCLVPDSGMFFLANDSQKILTYYIPSLGPAPSWCSFLDNITEELEEINQAGVFDDYKFVTANELAELGLSSLIGTNLLRAYMHGYFIDNRLYNKSKQLLNPFAYDEYRKTKIREKIDEERGNRVKVVKLPSVNRELAERLMMEASMSQKQNCPKRSKKKQIPDQNLMQDSRFKDLFERSDFQIDPESDEFKMLNPALVKLQQAKRDKLHKWKQENLDDEEEKQTSREVSESSENNSSVEESSESSSEDDEQFRQNIKETYRELRNAKSTTRNRDFSDEEMEKTLRSFSNVRFMEMSNSGAVYGSETSLNGENWKDVPIEKRLYMQPVSQSAKVSRLQNMEIVAQVKPKSVQERERRQQLHRRERIEGRRSAAALKKKNFSSQR
ncbi:Nucleolar protein 10 [Trichinella papuae]|uniref:Nucleolar protein 10 n=1 Tax=Trichinella papuae TaxID=268474 RepID=A0A0V1MNU1_9BILA|nr:Nucleolar protein 10 [Trichinella papuae]